jgi:hypothetical protein
MSRRRAETGAGERGNSQDKPGSGITAYKILAFCHITGTFPAARRAGANNGGVFAFGERSFRLPICKIGDWAKHIIFSP